MSPVRSSRPFRFGALLCIVLVALFAGMSLSRTMDRIQHGVGPAQTHAPMLFSALSVEEAHDADHDIVDADDDEQDRSNAMPDGHHHHGDSGSGMILLAQTAIAAPLFGRAGHAMVVDRGGASSAIQGPERPPRLIALRV
jgi:hypothetical protein